MARRGSIFFTEKEKQRIRALQWVPFPVSQADIHIDHVLEQLLDPNYPGRGAWWRKKDDENPSPRRVPLSPTMCIVLVVRPHSFISLDKAVLRGRLAPSAWSAGRLLASCSA